jgi:hypothetical protein
LLIPSSFLSADDRAKLTIESVTSIHPGLVPHARLDWAGFHS